MYLVSKYGLIHSSIASKYNYHWEKKGREGESEGGRAEIERKMDRAIERGREQGGRAERGI